MIDREAERRLIMSREYALTLLDAQIEAAIRERKRLIKEIKIRKQKLNA